MQSPATVPAPVQADSPFAASTVHVFSPVVMPHAVPSQVQLGALPHSLSSVIAAHALTVAMFREQVAGVPPLLYVHLLSAAHSTPGLVLSIPIAAQLAV